MANHHYIPKCYQLGFVDPTPSPYPNPEPLIWQAELQSGRVRRRPRHKVGCAPGFYALGYGDETKNESAERAHGGLESAVAPLLARLNSGDFRLSEKEWQTLLYFGAVLATRGPGTKHVLMNMRRRAAKVIQDLLANLPLDAFIHQLKATYPNETFTREEASEHQARMKDPNRFVFTPSNAKVVETSLKTADDTIFPLFMGMSWTYFHAPANRPFLCSDQPVTWVDPTVPRASHYGHGLESKNIEVSFPLGASLALLGHRGTAPKHLNLNEALVDQINLRSIEQAQVEILGPTRESVEWALALLRPSTP